MNLLVQGQKYRNFLFGSEHFDVGLTVLISPRGRLVTSIDGKLLSKALKLLSLLGICGLSRCWVVTPSMVLIDVPMIYVGTAFFWDFKEVWKSFRCLGIGRE